MSVQSEKRLLTPEGGPLDRIVGFETEYGLSYDNEGYTEVTQLLARAVQNSIGKSNAFTAAGERIYIDIGCHPELATPEETNFLDAAHRILIGHSFMASKYKKICEWTEAYPPTYWRSLPGSKGKFDKNKVSLVANTCSPNNRSWASHENFLAPRKLEISDYVGALAAHHATRIVWSGSGAVMTDKNGNYSFALSEKAPFILDIAGEITDRNRGLVNLRDKPYADEERYRRIHNISGESVFSPVANALRLATGSIVLRACELGVGFDDLLPVNPVRAIHRISADPTLAAKVELSKPRRNLTGLEIQKAIAERAIEAATNAGYITAQELEWGRRWQELLEDLGNDPNKCANRVDWIVKQKLINREISKRREKGSVDSESAIAWQKAINYHSLYPTEGPGMLLIRRGFFQDSPTEEVLTSGLPLPSTRAQLRGRLIAAHEQAKVGYEAGWWLFRSSLYGNTEIWMDPYDTSIDEADGLFEVLG